MPPRKPHRNAAWAGLNRQLRVVDARAFAGPLLGGANAVHELAERAGRAKSLAGLLGVARDAGAPIDTWAVPDCGWQGALRARPELGCYPLGEAVERAYKRLLAELLLEAKLPPAAGDGGAEEKKILAALASRLKEADDDELLGRFVTELFFELALDAIRRSGSTERSDNAARYHRTANLKWVTLEAEAAWRDHLRVQCRVLAEALVPNVKALRRLEPEAAAAHLGYCFGSLVGRRPALPTWPVGPRVVLVEAAREGSEDEKRQAGAAADSMRLVLGGRRGNASLACRRLQLPSGELTRLVAPEPPGEAQPAERPTPPEPRVLDLIEIGAAVYLADLEVPRYSNLGRRLRLEIEVREPEPWQAARKELEAAVSFLGRDDFAIEFRPRPKEAVESDLYFPADLAGDRVCLFSGGLDSLAGAVHALGKGDRTILVSHYGHHSLGGLQRRLAKGLSAACDGRPFEQLGFHVHRSGSPRQWFMGQFLRGFMFLSLACAVARHCGINEVWITENGPLALNPLFTEARTNARGAHPAFIAAFQRLVRKVFGARPVIANPFLYRTKGEVAAELDRNGLRALLGRSNSCGNWGRVGRIGKQRDLDYTAGSSVRHDGECLPCVIRRVAVRRAGLGRWDAPYLVDFLAVSGKAYGRYYPTAAGGRIPRDRITAIADHHRFCATIAARKKNRNLLVRAPEFSVWAPGVDCGRLAAMYRRHAEEVRACLARGRAPLRRLLGL